MIFEEALNKYGITADRVVHIGDRYKCDVEWRFVDDASLSLEEKALINRLKDQYGAGLINA